MTVIGVDVGGTFTDIILVDMKSGDQYVHKLPSTPESQDIAVIRGISEILDKYDVDKDDVTLVVHGTTVATNAMLERKGARVVLVTTAGLEDVIEIGRQNRDEIYSVVATRSEPLVRRDDRIGVSERLDYEGRVLHSLTREEVERIGTNVAKRNPEAVALSLLFSYANPEHERVLLRHLQSSTDAYVVASSNVLPEFREFERTSTTVLEAYLGPLVVGYLDRLYGSLNTVCPRSKLAVMQSNGGTMLGSEARGNAIGMAISGLAGGVIGGWEIAKQRGEPRIITLDMGGTSCDISAVDGNVVIRPDNEVAGLPLRSPSVDVKTIGAGGGSIAWLDQAGILHVGPQSAGAVPGPASYGTGGTNATVTDANVVLGRLNPDFFLGGAMKLDSRLAHEAIKSLSVQLGLNVSETALGIIRISTANMVQAIREVTVGRGVDPREFVLMPFGGAGPTQAVDIAEELTIDRILVPPHPGITSALGLVCTDLRVDLMQSILKTATSENTAETSVVLENLTQEATTKLANQGAPPELTDVQWSIDMRYRGQSHELNIPVVADMEKMVRSSVQEFERVHRELFGYVMEGRDAEWVTARVSARSVAERCQLHKRDLKKNANPIGHRELLLRGGLTYEVEVFHRAELACGQVLTGPCVVEQLDTTIYVGPRWQGQQNADDSLMMWREDQ